MDNNSTETEFNKGVKSKKNNIKKRSWAFILYPESAPSNWLDELQLTGLQVVVSPLHDRDIDPTGEKKKSHYHVILIFNSPTSYKIVSSITANLNASIPQALESVKGYYRYLTHKDNPEKVQYEASDIRALNGFSITDYNELTKSEISEIKRSLISVIKENKLREYATFIDYVLEFRPSEEWDVAMNNTLFFDRYLSSCRYSVFDKK